MKSFPCLVAFAFSFLLTLLTGIGCRSESENMRPLAIKAGVPFITQDADGVPLLTTNEVLRIAYETARTNNFNLAGYVCTGMHFGGNSTNEWIRGRWLVNFNVSPKAVDYDVFILIDDKTRGSKLYSR